MLKRSAASRRLIYQQEKDGSRTHPIRYCDRLVQAATPGLIAIQGAPDVGFRLDAASETAS